MKFEFSGSLYRFANYQREVEIDGNTLRACVDSLIEKYPDLKATMLDAEGQFSGSHNVFLNGEQLERGSGQNMMATPLSETDVVYVLTAITGG